MQQANMFKSNMTVTNKHCCETQKHDNYQKSCETNTFMTHKHVYETQTWLLQANITMTDKHIWSKKINCGKPKHDLDELKHGFDKLLSCETQNKVAADKRTCMQQANMFMRHMIVTQKHWCETPNHNSETQSCETQTPLWHKHDYETQTWLWNTNCCDKQSHLWKLNHSFDKLKQGFDKHLSYETQNHACDKQKCLWQTWMWHTNIDVKHKNMAVTHKVVKLKYILWQTSITVKHKTCQWHTKLWTHTLL